jgi:hypothetical protein
MDMHVQNHLSTLGTELIQKFCDINGIRRSPIHHPKQYDENKSFAIYWNLNACGFFLRPELRTGIHASAAWGVFVMPDKCGIPARGNSPRMISWPGGITDRTPYGVHVHELGHYLDWYVSQESHTSSWAWYSSEVKHRSGEKPLTSYAAENDGEWFAEAIRLFVTNPPLFKVLRPKTYSILKERFNPGIHTRDWMCYLRNSNFELGSVPTSVLRSIYNRISKEA